MAIFFYTGNITPNGISIVSDDDTHIFSENAYVYHNDGVAINVENGSTDAASLVINGEVVSGAETFPEFHGIRTDGTDQVTISATGTVHAGVGIRMDGGFNVLHVNGTVDGAVVMRGNDNYASIGGFVNNGISASGDGGKFVVSGTVSHDNGSGVSIFGTNNVLSNSGTISSGPVIGYGAAVIVAPEFGMTTAVNTINNTGLISASVGNLGGFMGPHFFAIADAGYQASQADYGYSLTESSDLTLNNQGTINGHVFMGAGTDVYNGVGGSMTLGSRVYLGSGNDDFFGGNGREQIYDGLGNDDVLGGGGRDFMRTEGGQDEFDGGAGRDFLTYRDTGPAVRINLTTDSQAGGAAGNEAADDIILNIESVGGTNGGDDVLIGDGGFNSLYGYNGHDRLYGSGGDDRLLGGNGMDFFDGGADNDRLYGGNGADRFQLDRGDGNDTVYDFQDNLDTLEFDNFGYVTSINDLLINYASQQGSDVLFDFGTDGSMLVLNTNLAAVSDDVALV